MRVLCLAVDRRLAYLAKHVLAFEGYAVEVCRTVETACERLMEGPGLLVALEPLPGPLPIAGPVVVADAGVDPEALVAAVRAAAAAGTAGAA